MVKRQPPPETVPSAGEFDRDLAARVEARHLRTVSRCISWVENGEPVVRPLLDALSRKAGAAMVIGVTGVPGAGKSTLVPALARRFAADGSHVAILAVDPSSPLTGGAILGDRIRDATLGETGIFFRSVASRGSIGGLSRTLDDVVLLLDGAGFDIILIETVGTGQSEIAVTGLAHTTLMVTAPGLGDEIQAMKAGILEFADVIVVNKADSDRRGADTTALALRQALSENTRAHGLREGANPPAGARKASWLAPVRAVSALEGDGIEALVALVRDHRAFLAESHELEAWRRRRLVDRFWQATRDALFARLTAAFGTELEEAAAAVSAGETTPLCAAEMIARRAVGKDTNGGKPS